MQLVAAPNGRGHQRHQLEQASCAGEIVAQTPRAVDCFVDVGDDASPPAAHLVPEQPKAAGGVRPNGPFRYDTALALIPGPDRCHLDDVASFRHAHFECRVVEVASTSTVD